MIDKAHRAEKADSPKTSHAIVRETLGIGVEDADKKRMWMADAEAAVQSGYFHTARAIYAHALTVFPQKKSIWRRAAELEKAHGTVATLEAVLSNAVRACPKSELLWLFAAREKWKTVGDADAARKILQDAFASNPESERIWLAAVRLESDCGEQQRARALLNRARVKSGTAKVFIKSVKLEVLMDDNEEARKLLNEAIAAHPKVPKLWLMFADVERRTQADPHVKSTSEGSRTARSRWSCGWPRPSWRRTASKRHALAPCWRRDASKTLPTQPCGSGPLRWSCGLATARLQRAISPRRCRSVLSVACSGRSASAWRPRHSRRSAAWTR
jgi:predicted Zn-dependent protease